MSSSKHIWWLVPLIVGALLLVWYASGTTPSIADLKPSAVVSNDGLTARATLGVSTLTAGNPVPVWFTVENEGDQARHGITFEALKLDGMEPVGPCWEKIGGGSSRPVCLADVPTAAVHRWPLELEKESKVTFWAAVEASKSDTGTATLEAKLQAPASGGGSAFSELRLEGPVVNVTSRWFTPERVKSSLELLALPVVLALLGFYLNRANEEAKRRHDQLVADAERRHEEAAEKARQEHDQRVADEKQRHEEALVDEHRRHEKAVADENRRHEVWRQMLLKVHENAQQYYMPVSGAIYVFRERFDTLKGDLESQEDGEGAQRTDPETQGADLKKSLLFYLLKVFVYMRALAREIGGYYFQNRNGEEICLYLWGTFRKRCYSDDFQLEADFDYLAERLKGKNLATFNAWLEASSTPAEPRVASAEGDQVPLVDDESEPSDALLRLRAWFHPWLQRELDEEVDLYILRIFEAVLDYEMNVPYRLWYGESSEPGEVKRERTKELGACGRWVLDLEKSHAGDQSLEELVEKAKAYLGKDILARAETGDQAQR